ncbi:hypothetical protein AVEN_189820-1 [Araneus ventricosus]|uniref:Uncharacterized protein n=1 Tax=Araneus ventricosus TaxID=182803 RepID=A0A4Y2NNP8_ARAVE|nr:hypothetical protein AVEN_189820-1 [Araneus ventricosus]
MMSNRIHDGFRILHSRGEIFEQYVDNTLLNNFSNTMNMMSNRIHEGFRILHSRGEIFEQYVDNTLLHNFSNTMNMMSNRIHDGFRILHSRGEIFEQLTFHDQIITKPFLDKSLGSELCHDDEADNLASSSLSKLLHHSNMRTVPLRQQIQSKPDPYTQQN